jgi:hypothetical protein
LNPRFQCIPTEPFSGLLRVNADGAANVPEVLKQVKVNGTVELLPRGAKTMKFSGEGNHENALNWEVS